jgi:RNA polymerase sigma-70 factor (family 1)
LAEAFACDEKELLNRLAGGDENAFVTLFNTHQDHIFKVVYRFVKSQALAEELVQDIFLKVWQERQKLPSIQHFQNWLFILARNHLFTCLRRMALERKVRRAWTDERPLNENSTDHRLRNSQFNELLQETINSLPAQQQAVLRLAKEQYLTYEEIAQQLSISPNTVRIHMSRALAAVRKALTDKGIELVLLSAFYFRHL